MTEDYWDPPSPTVSRRFLAKPFLVQALQELAAQSDGGLVLIDFPLRSHSPYLTIAEKKRKQMSADLDSFARSVG